MFVLEVADSTAAALVGASDGVAYEYPHSAYSSASQQSRNIGYL